MDFIIIVLQQECHHPIWYKDTSISYPYKMKGECDFYCLVCLKHVNNPRLVRGRVISSSSGSYFALSGELHNLIGDWEEDEKVDEAINVLVKKYGKN